MSVVPPANTNLDPGTGLVQVRYITLDDPVYAVVTNRPQVDLAARDEQIQDLISGPDNNGPGSWLKPRENDTPNNKVFVEEGRIIFNSSTELFLAATDFASGITFDPVTAPGQLRWDLLGVDISVSTPVAIKVSGVETTSPTPPSQPAIPANMLPICFVYVDEDVTVVVNDSDIRDARQYLEKNYPDQFDLIFSPSAYTPTNTAETTATSQLAAHLNGIDLNLALSSLNIIVIDARWDETLIQAGARVATFRTDQISWTGDIVSANYNFLNGSSLTNFEADPAVHVAYGAHGQFMDLAGTGLADLFWNGSSPSFSNVGGGPGIDTISLSWDNNTSAVRGVGPYDMVIYIVGQKA